MYLHKAAKLFHNDIVYIHKYIPIHVHCIYLCTYTYYVHTRVVPKFGDFIRKLQNLPKSWASL